MRVTSLFFRYQSGFTPPGDIPFEDLSKADPESASYLQYINSAPNNSTIKGTVGAQKLKKRVGIFGIFSSNKVCDLKCFLFTSENEYTKIIFPNNKSILFFNNTKIIKLKEKIKLKY